MCKLLPQLQHYFRKVLGFSGIAQNLRSVGDINMRFDGGGGGHTVRGALFTEQVKRI